MMNRWRSRIAAATVLFTVGACSDPSGFEEETLIESVAPSANAVNVDPGTTISIQFTHGMMQGMENYIVLHEGSVSGPVVTGAWTWSTDRVRVTFRPAAALRPKTAYVIHIGGGLRDARGRVLGLGEHCLELGGQWAQRSMMGGSMMGAGWSHANGTYGMLFGFVTA